MSWAADGGRVNLQCISGVTRGVVGQDARSWNGDGLVFIGVEDIRVGYWSGREDIDCNSSWARCDVVDCIRSCVCKGVYADKSADGCIDERAIGALRQYAMSGSTDQSCTERISSDSCTICVIGKDARSSDGKRAVSGMNKGARKPICALSE